MTAVEDLRERSAEEVFTTICDWLASIGSMRTSSATSPRTASCWSAAGCSVATTEYANSSDCSPKSSPTRRTPTPPRLVAGRMAFLEWTEADHARVRDSADSFLIEDGWVVAQTIHYTVEPI